MVFLISACGLFSKNDAGDGSATQTCNPSANNTGIDAFKATIYPDLQQNCYECHNSVTPKAPSPFADDSPSTAYASAKRFANFSNPSGSAFVDRMRAGHNCGGNCSSLAVSFAADIGEWAKSDSAGSSSSCGDEDDAKVILTQAQSVPTSLSGSITLTYDLGAASPALPEATFQVTATRFTQGGVDGPGSYQLIHPMLAIGLQSNPKLNVRISKIEILFDGQENASYRSWLGTNFVVQPRSYPVGSPLTGWYDVNESPELVDWVNPNGDMVSFKLRISTTNDYPTIPANDPYICKPANLGRFQTMFTAIRTGGSQSCTSCHLGTNANAYAAFPMDAAGNATTCREFKKRTDLATPLNSAFYVTPLTGPTIHPVKIIFNGTVPQAINDWVTNER